MSKTAQEKSTQQSHLLQLAVRLRKRFNEHVLSNKYYEKFSDFRDAVLGYLEDLWTPTEEILVALKSRITDNFHVVGSILTKSSI